MVIGTAVVFSFWEDEVTAVETQRWPLYTVRPVYNIGHPGLEMDWSRTGAEGACYCSGYKCPWESSLPA